MIEFCARSPLRAPRCKSFTRNCSRLRPAWAPAAHDQKTRILPPSATAAQCCWWTQCSLGDTLLSDAAMQGGVFVIRVRSATADQSRLHLVGSIWTSPAATREEKGAWAHFLRLSHNSFSNKGESLNRAGSRPKNIVHDKTAPAWLRQSKPNQGTRIGDSCLK
jgi:hypothetical protein